MVKCGDAVSEAAFTNDENACSADTDGFRLYVISAAPTAAQLPRICASTSCLSVVAAIQKAQPTECVTSWGFELYADILTPIEAQCSGKTVNATAAPTTVPAATTATPGTTTTAPATTSAANGTVSPVATTVSTTTAAPPAGQTNTGTNATGIDSGSNVTMIVAIAGGVIVVVAIIGFLILRSRQPSKRHHRDDGDYGHAHHPIKREDSFAVMETPSRNTRSRGGGAGPVSRMDSVASSVPTQASSQTSSSHGTAAESTSAVEPMAFTDLWKDPELDAVRIDDVQISTSSRQLGRGGFCEVVVGRYEGTEVAIKRLLPDLRGDPESQAMLLAEAKTMIPLTHRHVVRLVGVSWNEPRDLCLVTELVRGTDMGKYIAHAKLHRVPPGFTTEKILMALQIADALQYLHGQRPPVLHRDLKPANVLLTDSNQVKVADFGIAREHTSTTKISQIGSKWWMAPEQALSNKYDEKVDIFAFGVLLSELDTHEAPYSQSLRGRSIADAVFFETIRSGRLSVTFSGGDSDPIAELGRACVRVLPRERPSAAELCRRLQVAYQTHRQRDDERRIVESVVY